MVADTRNLQLQDNQQNTRTWKLTQNGQYSAKSAYKARFLGSTKGPRLGSIWRTRAPPKCKIFAWLILQDRIWTSVRLQHRGWDCCSLACPLCRCEMKTAHHMVAGCRFTKRVFEHVANWAARKEIGPTIWPRTEMVIEWWTSITISLGTTPKGMRSLTLLIN